MSLFLSHCNAGIKMWSNNTVLRPKYLSWENKICIIVEQYACISVYDHKSPLNYICNIAAVKRPFEI